MDLSKWIMERTGDMEENKPAKKLDFISYAILLFIGLLSFSFGGGTIATIFASVGFVISIVLLMVVGEKLKKNEKLSFVADSLPLLVFMILISFNRFWLSSSSGFFSSLLLFLGLLGAYLLGFFLRKYESITPKIILAVVVILSGLYVLINLIINMVDYGFFYAALYNGKIYYLDGNHYLVSEEMKSLIGFDVKRTTLPYSSTLAFMLASILPSILFMNFSSFKEVGEGNFIKRNLNRIYLISVISAGIIGLFSLVFIPYTRALILLAVVFVFALVMRFVPYKKEAPLWTKIVGIAILIIAMAYIILLAYAGVKGNIDNILVTNGLVSDNLPVFKAIFENDKGIIATLFGTNLNDYFDKLNSTSVSNIRTNSFEFEALLEGGLICFVALIAAIVFSVISLRKYLHKEDKITNERMVFALIILGWFIYKSLLVDTVPFVGSNIYMTPFSQDSTIIIVLMLLGYTHENIFSIKTEGEKHEEK